MYSGANMGLASMALSLGSLGLCAAGGLVALQNCAPSTAHRSGGDGGRRRPSIPEVVKRTVDSFIDTTGRRGSTSSVESIATRRRSKKSDAWEKLARSLANAAFAPRMRRYYEKLARGLLLDAMPEGFTVRDFKLAYEDGDMPAPQLKFLKYAHWDGSENVEAALADGSEP
eukprot:COSAG02_NODE_24497_length_686_cov_1.320273_1_plen_170_part_10